MPPFIEINGRRIGPGYPIYVVAEISANHERDFDQAVKLVHAAKRAGANAVKLQTYTPDTLTIQSEQKYFRIDGGTLWDGRTLHDLYKGAYMPWEWQPQLKAIAEDLSLDLFSTAFDPSAVDFLEEMGVPVHKIASFEIVDIPLIEKIGRTRKPLILSTGMATLEEIREAIEAARLAGAPQMALLKCTSAYPAPSEEMNLKTIPHLAETFKVPIGLSDHTLGVVVPSLAVALGACIIEKHFTLTREIPGPDNAFSLEPGEFKTMVDSIRVAEKALGGVHYGMTEQESKSLVFRRSLFVVQDIKAGDIFTDQNIRSIRPGQGLAPKYIKDILGNPAAWDIARGTPLRWEHVILRA
jgi:pseudaminic acid synthase